MGKHRGWSEQSRGRVPRSIWWAAILVIMAAGIALAWWSQAPPLKVATSGPELSSGTAGPAIARRETRPTLDPALFVGKAALAHQVAREIPGVLDQLYCYCECDKHLGHKSLLSCYTDGHAAT